MPALRFAPAKDIMQKCPKCCTTHSLITARMHVPAVYRLCSFCNSSLGLGTGVLGEYSRALATESSIAGWLSHPWRIGSLAETEQGRQLLWPCS